MTAGWAGRNWPEGQLPHVQTNVSSTSASTQSQERGLLDRAAEQAPHQAEQLSGVADEVGHLPGPREKHGLAQPPPLPVHPTAAENTGMQAAGRHVWTWAVQRAGERVAGGQVGGQGGGQLTWEGGSRGSGCQQLARAGCEDSSGRAALLEGSASRHPLAETPLPCPAPAARSTHMAKWCLRLEPRRWPKIFSSRCSGIVMKLATSAGSAAPGSSSDASSASSSYSPSASARGLSSATAWARRMVWRSQAAGPRRVGAASADALLPPAAAAGPAGTPAPGPPTA